VWYPRQNVDCRNDNIIMVSLQQSCTMVSTRLLFIRNKPLSLSHF
jgi:hypothetical protein